MNSYVVNTRSEEQHSVASASGQDILAWNGRPKKSIGIDE